MTVTVTLKFDLKINRDHIHSDTHVCAEFDEPRSIQCLVIYTTFGLYINMLMVTVTLTLDVSISKSIGIVYTPRQMSVSNFTKLFCDYLSSRQGLVYIPTCRRSL